MSVLLFYFFFSSLQFSFSYHECRASNLKFFLFDSFKTDNNIYYFVYYAVDTIMRNLTHSAFDFKKLKPVVSEIGERTEIITDFTYNGTDLSFFKEYGDYWSKGITYYLN